MLTDVVDDYDDDDEREKKLQNEIRTEEIKRENYTLGIFVHNIFVLESGTAGRA